MCNAAYCLLLNASSSALEKYPACTNQTRYTLSRVDQQILTRLPWALGCILQRSGNLWPSGNNIINLSKVVAWLSGRALVLIKVATLCLAWLILS